MSEYSDKYKCQTTMIAGHDVTLETWTEENGDERSDASIIKKVNGSEFGGSLEMLNGCHTLEDHITGEEIPVPDAVRNAITTWAEDHGY